MGVWRLESAAVASVPGSLLQDCAHQMQSFSLRHLSARDYMYRAGTILLHMERARATWDERLLPLKAEKRYILYEVPQCSHDCRHAR